MARIIKRIVTAILASVMAVSFTACGDTQSSSVSVAEGTKEGKFVITLHPEVAPITCENFESLVSSGFYDGLTFHRVVEDFMAQGGDPNGNGTGGSENTIKGEFSENGVDNTLSHTRGVVSMARSTGMDSASSQFFICYSDDDVFLDGSYASFGVVTEGMDVVDDFLNVERVQGNDNAISSPTTPITIKSAKIISEGGAENPQVEFTVTYSPQQG